MWKRIKQWFNPTHEVVLVFEDGRKIQKDLKPGERLDLYGDEVSIEVW